MQQLDIDDLLLFFSPTAGLHGDPNHPANNTSRPLLLATAPAQSMQIPDLDGAKLMNR